MECALAFEVLEVCVARGCNRGLGLNKAVQLKSNQLASVPFALSWALQVREFGDGSEHYGMPAGHVW